MLNTKKIPSILIFIVFIVLLFSIPSILFLSENEGENALFPIVGKEQGKELGNITIYFLILGMIYVLIKRLYIYIRKFVNKEKYPEIIDYSKKIYMSSRKPLFYLHLSVNIIATILGLIHGLSVELEKPMMLVTGFLGVIVMATLSISGLIMWKKFWPFWSNRESKLLISAVHRQWLFSAMLVVIIYAHLFIFRST